MRSVTGLAFSPDGTTLASIGDDRKVLLWSPSSGALTQVLAGHLTPVSALAFGSSGQTLASVSTDGQVIVWDLPAGTERFTSDLPGYPPVASGQPSGAPPLTGGQNDAPQTTVSARSGQPGMRGRASPIPKSKARTSKAAPPGKTARHSRRGWKGITSLTLSPTGARVASSHFGGAVRMWNDGLRELSADAGPDDAPATGVAFTADGKRLVSVSRDSEVRWWDAATGQLRQRSFGHQHPIRTTAASQWVTWSPAPVRKPGSWCGMPRPASSRESSIGIATLSTDCPSAATASCWRAGGADARYCGLGPGHWRRAQDPGRTFRGSPCGGFPSR